MDKQIENESLSEDLLYGTNSVDPALWECQEYLYEYDPKEAAQRISSRVAMLDRAERWGVLGAVLDEAEPEYFWPIFLHWWPDIEFPHRWENLADRLRDVHRAIPAYEFMSGSNRAFFDNLPNNIPIYRGASRKFALGISWTTDRSTAQWFARRYEKNNSTVFSGTVFKGHVWTVFTDRGESEILCDPVAVRLRK
jgi:hypothetical protein